MSMSVYTCAFDTVIRHIDAERAHELGLGAVSLAGRIPPVRALLRSTLGHLEAEPAPTTATGTPGGRMLAGRDTRRRPARIGARTVPGRLGLAAGMDKDAAAVLGMCALGFAFVEIGTVTPRPQPGNEAPRMWRLLDERGVRNRMGFNNLGAPAAAEALRRLRATRSGRAAIVGANIGRNKSTPEDRAADDYRACACLLAPWADFIVVNVSSPNTPGLRGLQTVDRLRAVLEAARLGCEQGDPRRRVPLFVKIAPDLSDREILDITALTGELGLEGVVATNTTTDHDLGGGGVSGQPLFPRALEVVRLVGSRLEDDQTLIATGGIGTPDQARQMLDAGADLLEAFTAFIYEGPSWPGRMNRALADY
jgi:dihydroorotate dehydrogenase